MTTLPLPPPVSPTIKTLRLDHLTIDRVVQRALDDAWVQKKLREEGFIPEALGVFVVSHRADGSYCVIDGQHRRALATQAGHPDLEVDCQVHEGLSLSEEAAMFRHHNDRRAVPPLDKFLIRKIEGDSSAVVCHDLLVKHGWKVTSSRNDGNFAAVAALENIYRGASIRTGPCPKVIDTMLTIIGEAWGRSANGVRGEIISGLGMVLLAHMGEADIPKLVHELAIHEGGPLGVIGKARGLRALRRGTIGDCVAEVIIAAHNGKKRRRLPEWRSAS